MAKLFLAIEAVEAVLPVVSNYPESVAFEINPEYDRVFAQSNTWNSREFVALIKNRPSRRAYMRFLHPVGSFGLAQVVQNGSDAAYYERIDKIKCIDWSFDAIIITVLHISRGEYPPAAKRPCTSHVGRELDLYEQNEAQTSLKDPQTWGWNSRTSSHGHARTMVMYNTKKSCLLR